uniref:Ribosomal protein S11 n=1 Tax=Aureoumbra lagunensis TaxID=44058 RepID=A0A7U0KSU7_9STRA|nr:ribosomal protein S11 [Aureoumbra lagunensis]QQW50414.1 ribosomal protein S11 [Aureoumbra lagunensis]
MFFYETKQTKDYFLFLKCSKNNTIGTLLNLEGKVVCNVSAGCFGYKNSKKRNSYVIQHLIVFISDKLKSKSKNSLLLKIDGVSVARYSVIKEFYKAGIKIKKIYDNSKVPFNGCRYCKR